MATTGERFPTTAVEVSESPWNQQHWVTVGNVVSDNAATANITSAQFDSPKRSYVLKTYGYGFTVPTGATINGVICRVNAWYRSGQGTGSLDLCQLLNTATAKVGTNQCGIPVALTTDNTTVIVKGSSSDLWANALTPEWVNSNGFGVALGIQATAANADVDIDYVTLEVYYTEAATVVDDPSLRFEIVYRTDV